MSYIESNLMKNEHIIYRATLHWSIFIKSSLFFLFGLILKQGGSTIGGIFIFAAILLALIQLINYKTSEFALTNKRVIVKVGFIRRNSLETLLNKVEGIQVNQGISGRLLNYGSITISGTGGSKDPFKNIANPLEFRKIVQEQIAATSE